MLFIHWQISRYRSELFPPSKRRKTQLHRQNSFPRNRTTSLSRRHSFYVLFTFGKCSELIDRRRRAPRERKISESGESDVGYISRTREYTIDAARSDRCLRTRDTHPFDTALRAKDPRGVKVQAMSLHSRDTGADSDILDYSRSPLSSSYGRQRRLCASSILDDDV